MKALRSRMGGWWLASLLAIACGDDSQAVVPDAGPAAPDANVGGGSMDGGVDAAAPIAPPPPNTPVLSIMCGDTLCEVPMMVASFGVQPCCAAKNACGEMTPLAPGSCLAIGQPGGLDPTCPDYDVMGLTTWPGCCAPGGKCGAYSAGEQGLGCIPNADLNQETQSCDYDPDNVCSRLLSVECDGPEDCGKGKMCCAQFAGGYRSFTCQDDCAALETAGGIWSEVCHPGQKCAVAGYECQANVEYLPDFLYRCRDSGTKPGAAGSTSKNEVNCGDVVCGAGEKCCVSVPAGAPYCAPEADACLCNGNGSHTPGDGLDGGTDDAG